MGDSSGDRNPGDGEVPLHDVTLGAFEIDESSVTNEAFGAFVDATGYRTDAEVFGFSAVFHLAVAARLVHDRSGARVHPERLRPVADGRERLGVVQ